MYALIHVYKIVCATKIEFRRSLKDRENKLPNKNAFSQIIY